MVTRNVLLPVDTAGNKGLFELTLYGGSPPNIVKFKSSGVAEGLNTVTALGSIDNADPSAYRKGCSYGSPNEISDCESYVTGR